MADVPFQAIYSDLVGPEQRYAISHGGLLVVLLPQIRVLVVALEPIRLSMATSYKPR